MDKQEVPSPRSSGAGLARFALSHPVTVCMCFLSMLIFGAVASRLLPLEKFPGIDIPQIVVEVPYEDATPAEVERMITRPLEEVLATMSGIKRIQATSYENRAQVFIEFDWDENIKAKSIEAREKIDTIRNTLPDDVERILVFKFNTNDMPVFQLRVSSERDLSNAYDLLDRNLKKPLERVPGVSKVELYGVLKKQIVIHLNPTKLTAMNIDTPALVQRLRQANFSASAGALGTENKVLVNPMGEFTHIDDFKNFIVRPGVKLKDIADVGLESPQRDEGRHLDRTYAVGFNIYRESGSNLVEVADSVMAVIKKAETDPEFNGINLFVMEDTAKSVSSSLGDLIAAGLLGALLSVIVLYAFLRQLSSTLIVVLSVPFSICITLGLMYLMGYTLNILSLMGLMLAVGMLVDNAVVVTESIFQARQTDSNALRATQTGINRVSLAVIAGTATTAIVFLPNIVGVKIDITIFLEHVAIAICISLFASLLLSQTLIPLLVSKIKVPKQKSLSQPGYITRYGNVLRWSLKHQKVTGLIAMIILLSTAIPMGAVSGDDEGNDDEDGFWLNYHITQNYSLEEVERTVVKMEEFLYSHQQEYHIKQVYSYFEAGHATSRITLEDDLPVPASAIKDMIREDMPKFARARPSFQWNSGGGGGVRLTLLGDSTTRLRELADNIVPVLASIDGLDDVKADVGAVKQEYQIKVNSEKAWRLGIKPRDVASLISTALRGSNLRTFRYGDSGEIGVQLKFGEPEAASLQTLKSVVISQQDGRPITLDMVANIIMKPQLSEIRRFYRQTALSIGANLSEELTVEEARERIENAMQYIVMPTGYQWTLDGSFRRQDEATAVMQMNMLLAICMIYIVMAALFESILLPTAVITSLLFSFTGVFWAFLITGTAMSVMGMIGMLILMGIVVNNGIVLVDRINQLAVQGVSLYEAVIEGCMTRIRPVLMTVATTILGLIPLAVGTTRIGGDGPAYSPMAIAIIGGLVFSTLTSLILVPLTYVALLRMRYQVGKMLKSSKLKVDKLLSVKSG